ncbi:MAG: MmgE/PrpD family protein [Chloroflexi bacterium]|nr:MmgE/PrpD family protein [Chloroflexota bacterium]MYE47281.1 MmgE/PrpD family protein [Chloroflexota bacterium]
MTLARDLAAAVTALERTDLDAEAVRWAQLGITDAIACAIAGSQEAAPRLAIAAVGANHEEGPCLLLGLGRRTGPLSAALVNGVAAHALDFDDVNDVLGGHPSAPLVPALLALGEAYGASGSELLLAYVAGFEAECKIGLAVNFHHYDKGWHPTATLGVFGAAAASAKLLRLSEEETATALSIAASFASGLKANFGTMTKPLHVGHASRNGAFAALLAREGFTAGEAAFEHEMGFFEVYNGAGTYDASRVLGEWADPLSVVEPGVGVKPYPCCGSTHAPIDAVRALVSAKQIAPEDVVSVRVLAHPSRIPHIDRPEVHTGLEGKFSIQYCVARAIHDGALRLSHFEDGQATEAAVQALMPGVSIEAGVPRESDERLAVRVEIATRDGATHDWRVEEAIGTGGARSPIPEADFRAKFDDCCTRAMSAESTDRLYALCGDLDAVASVADLTETVAEGARAAVAG